MEVRSCKAHLHTYLTPRLFELALRITTDMKLVRLHAESWSIGIEAVTCDTLDLRLQSSDRLSLFEVLHDK